MGVAARTINFFKYSVSSAKAVHAKSGRPTFFVLCDMAGCLVKRGVWPDQYRHMGFEALNSKQRDAHWTNRQENRLLRQYGQFGKISVIFRNKYLFYLVYGRFFGRECKRSDRITAEEAGALNEKGFIYKPLTGSFGRGVRLFGRGELGSGGRAAEYLHGLEPGVAEELIVQHPALNEMYPDAVAPIRLATVYEDGRCNFIYGTLTLGIDKRYANASSGALFALIDVNTGEVISNGVDYDHNRYEKHPVTGRAIKGFRIPMWGEVLAMAGEAAALVPEMHFASWDIAVTPGGPVLIEGNHMGGFTGYQFYEFAEEGLDTETAKLLKPYLKK